MYNKHQHPAVSRRRRLKLEERGMRDDVCIVSAGFCCPGEDGRLGLARHFYCFLDTTGCSANTGSLRWPQLTYFTRGHPLQHNTQHEKLSWTSVTNLRNSFAWEWAQLWQLSLVPCFEEFNLKFNQAAEHDRKNCLNSQHHQILRWYHIFAFLKMNFNPSGKIWENWALPKSRRSFDCICIYGYGP